MRPARPAPAAALPREEVLGGVPVVRAPAARAARDVRERYRHIARYYDVVYRGFLAHGSRVLVSLRRIEPAERVLEVGVGTGYTLPHYPHGVRVCAVDICPEMIAVAAHKRLPRTRAAVSLYAMDAHDLAFRDGSFDVLLFPHSLGLMEDPPRVLGEVARVSAPGAELRILHTFEWRNRILHRFETALYDAGEERLGWGRPLNLERTTAWCAKHGFEPVLRRRLGWKLIAVFRKRER